MRTLLARGDRRGRSGIGARDDPFHRIAHDRGPFQGRTREADLGKAADAAEVVLIGGAVFVRQFDLDRNGAGAGLGDLRGHQPVIAARGRPSYLPDLSVAPDVAADQADGCSILPLDPFELPFRQFDCDESMLAIGQIEQELPLDDRRARLPHRPNHVIGRQGRS